MLFLSADSTLSSSFSAASSFLRGRLMEDFELVDVGELGSTCLIVGLASGDA